MRQELETALSSVCRQVLVDEAKVVEVGNQRFPVKRTSRNRLRQVDFSLDGQEFRALEQNPDTASCWAQLARQGKKVMQFLSGGRYIAVIVDGKVMPYGARR